MKTKELKAVRLELSPEDHKKLRILAAKKETSMALLVRMLVEDFLDRNEDVNFKQRKR